MAKKKTSPERYTTVAGEVIEYPTPSPDVAAYLARVRDAANDPRVSESELVEFVYSKDNPVLDATLMPGRGAVTKAVFADPVYQVMHDLLYAKRLQMEGAAASSPTPPREGVSVADAARQLGMSASAVRQAIARGDLEATKVRGAHSINPASVESYRDRVTRRGPSAEPALRVRMGNCPGKSFRVKVLGTPMRLGEKEKLEGGGFVLPGEVARFDRATISITGERTHRVFRLAPAETENRFEWGPFSIEGRYRVTEKLNQPDVASDAWKVIRPDGLALWGVQVYRAGEDEQATAWVVAGTEDEALSLAAADGFEVTGEVNPGMHAPKEVRRVIGAETPPRVVYGPGTLPRPRV